MENALVSLYKAKGSEWKKMSKQTNTLTYANFIIDY